MTEVVSPSSSIASEETQAPPSPAHEIPYVPDTEIPATSALLGKIMPLLVTDTAG